MIVVSMFHERDLYINSTGDQVVYVAPAFKNHNSGPFITWINTDFKKLENNFFDDSYLKRYENFLSSIRSLFPNIPIIIIKRLSHFPIFGPHAHSDLLCWGKHWKKFNPYLWGTKLEGLNIYALEQVVEANPDVIIISSIFEDEIRKNITSLDFSSDIQLLNSSLLFEELHSIRPVSSYH